MKICICDYHIASQMWHCALLRSMGHEVHVRSLSNHTHLIPKHYLTQLGTFAEISRQYNISSYDSSKINIDEVNQYDLIISGFPPCFIEAFMSLPHRPKLLMNACHRFNMHRENDRTYIKRIKDAVLTKELFLGAACQYDFEYIKHYLDIEPFKLYMSCEHIPPIEYAPILEEIIVGPVHNIDVSTTKAMVDQFNAAKIKCQLIRNIYSHYEYTDLVKHPAAIILPYSAFAASIVELYHLCIPLFVPTPDYLLRTGLLVDVALAPIYTTVSQMISTDIRGTHHCSPNSVDQRDILYWLQYAWYYNQPHIIQFDSINDLSQKLKSTDLNAISQQMRVTNYQTRQASFRAWESCFEYMCS